MGHLFSILYFFIWRPFKKRIDAKRTALKITKEGLPEIAVAAANGHDDLIRKLHSEGVDINASGKAGQTALMMAARNDKRSTVILLLECGADPEIKTKVGNTAFSIAKKHGHLTVCDILGQSF